MLTSWKLLDESERDIFAQLLVFTESFSAEAAEEVLRPIPSFGDSDQERQASAKCSNRLLVGLRNKSLLRVIDPSQQRYSLYEFVRNYVARHSDTRPELLESARRRHFEYYSFLFPWISSIGRAQPTCMLESLADLANVVSACRWGLGADGYRERAARLALALHLVLLEAGEGETARSLLSVSVRHEFSELTFHTRLAQANVEAHFGNWDAATEYSRQAKAASRRLECDHFLPLARIAAATTLAHGGRTREAKVELPAADDVGLVNYARFQARHRFASARIALNEGDLLQAERLYLDCGALALQSGSRRLLLESEVALEETVVLQGRDLCIHKRLSAVGETDSLGGSPRIQALLLLQKATAQHFNGDLESAHRGYEEVIERCVRVSMPAIHARSTLLQAVAFFEQGDYLNTDRSLDTARVAPRSPEQVMQTAMRVYLLSAQGYLRAATEQLSALRKCVAEPPELPHSSILHMAEVYVGLVRNTDRLSDAAGARKYLDALEQIVRSANPDVERGCRGSVYAQLLKQLLLACRHDGTRDCVERADLIVSSDGSWFRREGARVDLATSPVLCRLLSILASAAGEFVSSDDLVKNVWSGERLTHKSGLLRVRTAVSRLRTSGLHHHLLSTTGRGYRLVGAEVECEPT